MKQDAEVASNLPRKYWYKHYITECPVCGGGDHIRVRQYTPAPEKYSQERWDYDGMAYDWCMEY